MIIDNDVVQGDDSWKALHYGRATASQFSRIITPGASEKWICLRADGETCGTTHTSERVSVYCCAKLNKQEIKAVSLPGGQGVETFPFKPTRAPIELAAASRLYAAQLAGERLCGGPEDVQEFWSAHIQRGIDHEPRVRAAYRLETGLDVRTVGFIRLSDAPYAPGCSPDALVHDPLSGAVLGGLEVKCPNLAQFQLYKEEGVLPSDYKCQVHGCLAITGLPWWDLMIFHSNVPDKPFRIRVTPDDFTQAIRDILPRFEAEVQKRVALLQ